MQMMVDWEKTGRSIRNKMNENSLTIKECAKDLNVSNPAVNNYLTGKRRIPIETAKYFAEKFSCDINDIFKWKK